MKILKSKFDPSIQVVYINEDDERYNDLSRAFDKHGHAFLVQSTIFIDETALRSENLFDSAHLTFIESHEVAHAVLKHRSSVRNKMQEAEADYIGIMLCKKKRYSDSVKVGIKYFKSRNSISFQKFDEKYGKSLRSSIE